MENISSPTNEEQKNYSKIGSKLIFDEEMQEVHRDLFGCIGEMRNSNTQEEIPNELLSGVAADTTFKSIQESLKIIGKLQKGQEVSKEVVVEALKNILTTLSSSALRETIIKCLEV